MQALEKDRCCAPLYYSSSHLKQSKSFCFINNLQISLIHSEHFNHLPTSVLTPDRSQDRRFLNYWFVLCSMRPLTPSNNKYTVRKKYGHLPILSIWSRVHLCQKSSEEWDKFQIYNTLNENKLLHMPVKGKSFLTQTCTYHESQNCYHEKKLRSLFFVILFLKHDVSFLFGFWFLNLIFGIQFLSYGT